MLSLYVSMLSVPKSPMSTPLIVSFVNMAQTINGGEGGKGMIFEHNVMSIWAHSSRALWSVGFYGYDVDAKNLNQLNPTGFALAKWLRPSEL
ncbi:hypothetical protein TNCT_659541 [Trichonephila clavata]|uniref:Uncharacterized protein n=1 Tax=Trichonephila clavata TaxID=2740835 RepID=A0A8X6IXT8_TRICU|nr:hypothetical protein TNCT_659541 [Trichonephila clavata]